MLTDENDLIPLIHFIDTAKPFKVIEYIQQGFIFYDLVHFNSQSHSQPDEIFFSKTLAALTRIYDRRFIYYLHNCRFFVIRYTTIK